MRLNELSLFAQDLHLPFLIVVEQCEQFVTDLATLGIPLFQRGRLVFQSLLIRFETGDQGRQGIVLLRGQIQLQIVVAKEAAQEQTIFRDQGG